MENESDVPKPKLDVVHVRSIWKNHAVGKEKLTSVVVKCSDRHDDNETLKKIEHLTLNLTN